MSNLTRVMSILLFAVVGFSSVSYAAPDAETTYIFNSFSLDNWIIFF